MKIDRLVSIILILLDKEKERISAQELANRFEVSPRTIYRDIDAINTAGVPVLSVAGAGGGFEIMPEYKIDKKFFSTADLSAILLGLSSISGMIRYDELANALAKVKSFVPAERAKDVELRANQVHIDLSPWIAGNKDISFHLDAVKTALEEKRLLSFTYRDRHGNKTQRKAEVYQLILKSSQWYFQGYCCSRNDFRLFKLSRMSDLQIQEEIFAPREHPKPQLGFDDILETMQARVKLRIHKSIMDRLLDFFSAEQFLRDSDFEDNSHYLVYFPFIENDYYYNILLSFGGKCECLEPLHVRAELKRRILEMAALYED